MNRNRNDEVTDSWRSESTCLSGLATPIRHRTVDKSRLQEILSSSDWNDSSGGWHSSLASPLRRRSTERSNSNLRLSPNHWNERNSDERALIKDARSQPCIATDGWEAAAVSESIGGNVSGGYEGSALEPFIPPPPLLDFETANLLPPLGVDVSSPSDDASSHGFMSLASMPNNIEPNMKPIGDKSSVNWVQVPPQYATLRRPRHGLNAGHVGPKSSESLGDSYASLRRPKLSLSNAAELQPPPSPSPSPSPSWNATIHQELHNSKADGSAMSRKCTCGQKMRLSAYASQADPHAGPSPSDREDLVAAGIATLRRPIKRKGQRNSPMTPQNTLQHQHQHQHQHQQQQPQQQQQQQLPKLETSVLLDKLLRAGALRPEDYLVLSRMERMIMATHNSQSSRLKAQSGACKSPGLSLNPPTDMPSNMSMAMNMDLRSRDLETKSQLVQPKNCQEKCNDLQYELRQQVGKSQVMDGLHSLTRMQQPQQQQHQGHLSQLPARKDVERPVGPMDYYTLSYSGRNSSGQHSHVATTDSPHVALGHNPNQFNLHGHQMMPNCHGRNVGVDSSGSGSGFVSPAAAAYVNRCPCCGSQSHVAGVSVHHLCTLCGGGPHHYASKLPPPSTSPASSVSNYAYLPARPQQQQYGGNIASSEMTKYTSSSAVANVAVNSQPNPQVINRLRIDQVQHSTPSDTARQTMASPSNLTPTPSTQHLQRSISAPAQTTRITQLQVGQTNQDAQRDNRNHSSASVGRIGFTRSLSRTDAVKEYLKKSAATFFGVDESKEAELRQRWEDRRRRLAERRCGQLREEPENEDMESRDLVDGSIPLQSCEPTESVTMLTQLKRRESVAKMTWEGLSYLATAVVRFKSSGPSPEDPTTIRSRSVAQTMSLRAPLATNAVTSVSARRAALPPDVTMDTGGTSNLASDSLEEEVFFDIPPPSYEDAVDSSHIPSPMAPSGPRSEPVREPRSARWRRVMESRPTHMPPTSLVDRLMDNSNRRQYGMGIVGRITGRSLRRSMTENNKYLKKQLDSFEDHRPYFTYWTCTVQVLIMLVALFTYGFGPIGVNLSRRSGLVLVTSLSLQQVDYYEPSNFWIGPRAADLIHLGAKYAPCMRPDTQLRADIETSRSRERQTACCIRNDNSGCVQTSKDQCSDLTSTWKKWNVVQSGPGGRISGSVCGQDPNFCIEPASVAPFEWPDDITKWPKCRKKLPGLGSESKLNSNGVSKTTGHAEHMVCEVIGHPCCIGIHGECRIATREYCDFVRGHFHEEASLCSQVSCMNDVCGMLPFHNPDISDQFYRLWTSLFLHAGLVHLALSITFQMVIMRDLEKLAGPVRIGIIYLGSGIFGNLASALFVPYRAEVGPSGSHFGLIACLCVEVLHAWPLLKTPWWALGRLLLIVVFLFIAGLLPWVDNFAHIFGFISGGLLSYTFLPFITVGMYDRRRKLVLIAVTLSLAVILLTTLVLLLYVWPIQDSGVIEALGYLNCIPITRDFCAEQNIHFNKREVMIT